MHSLQFYLQPEACTQFVLSDAFAALLPAPASWHHLLVYDGGPGGELGNADEESKGGEKKGQRGDGEYWCGVGGRDVDGVCCGLRGEVFYESSCARVRSGGDDCFGDHDDGCSFLRFGKVGTVVMYLLGKVVEKGISKTFATDRIGGHIVL